MFIRGRGDIVPAIAFLHNCLRLKRQTEAAQVKSSTRQGSQSLSSLAL